MEQLGSLRTALFKAATKELNAFERTLKEEVTRQNEQISKNRSLQNEIDFLRQQYGRISELEREPRVLRNNAATRPSGAFIKPPADGEIPRLESDRSTQGSGKSPVDSMHVTIEEYEHCRERFLQCSHELERVKKARDILEASAKHWKRLYESLQRMDRRQTSKDSRRKVGEGTLLRAGSTPIIHSESILHVCEPKNTYGDHGPQVGDSMPIALGEGPRTAHGLEEYFNPLVSDRKPQTSDQITRPTDADTSISTPITPVDDDSAETSDESEQRLAQASPLERTEGPKAHSIEQYRVETMQPGSDDLVVVSERSLKRNRDGLPAKSSQKPASIKVEVLSSPPNANTLTEGVQEMVDLDEISGPLYTPRKDQRKRLRMWHERLSSPSMDETSDAPCTDRLLFEGTDEQAMYNVPALEPISNQELAEEDAVESNDEEEIHKRGEEYKKFLRTEEKQKRYKERRAKQRLHNERQFAKRTRADPRNIRPLQHHSGFIQTNEPSRNHVLHPTDANRLLPRTGEHAIDQRQKTHSTHRDHTRLIPLIAEDGEEALGVENELPDDGRQENPRISNNEPIASELSKPQSQSRRLGRLLAEPSPEKPPLRPKNANAGLDKFTDLLETRTIYAKQSRESIAPETPDLSRPKQFRRTRDVNAGHMPIPRSLMQPPTSRMRQHPKAFTPNNPSIAQDTPSARPKSNTFASTTMTPISPIYHPNYITPFSKTRLAQPPKKDPPLCSRPLLQLCLEDFKINPKHNQGYDYAFKQVVRKHNQRKCLPGCTRLDCCGAIFRKMAESGMFKPFHTALPPSQTQEDEDVQMITDFLGDGAAGRLRKMSREERNEVLLQAKTKILADHYGRHREVYAREPSPVGYWDVDMPNTQEAREQGRLAEVRMRQKVEERWREAMKGEEGLWMFTDE
ncbi:MAG: hypothetical protein Q9181_003582 [Wetmoreana brouardii]